VVLWGIEVGERSGLPPGTVLDRSYRIVRMLGAGGFGITYEAEDIELRAKVAIKEYFTAEFGDRDETMSVRPRTDSHRPTFEWGRSSFLEEAQTLVRFKHPSIVRVTRIFRANATAYMVMDFEEGPSLVPIVILSTKKYGIPIPEPFPVQHYRFGQPAQTAYAEIKSYDRQCHSPLSHRTIAMVAAIAAAAVGSSLAMF
jgi:serine/threonine protein kinase